MITLNVNGERHEIQVEDSAPLMWVLREKLGLTSVKFGCGVGVCGACTVHVDGEARRSCTVAVSDVVQSRVVTLEGLGASIGLAPSQAHPVQAAWIEHRVPQCGYCQPGMIMAAAALIKRSPQPSAAEINDSITNLCRCGTYPRVRRAIDSLARGNRS